MSDILSEALRNGPKIVSYPRRPALRWHGGKWRLASWIVEHFGPHRIYVEPFGGAASVLLKKQPCYAEVYNDLDQDVVNFFRVLRDLDKAGGLIHALKITPFAREEFESAYGDTEDPIERARRLVVRSYMGFGSDAPNRLVKTGFRSNSNRSGTTPAHDWANYPDQLMSIVNRFTGVVIENADAMDVMRRHDGPDTLHYVDPPYMPETRSDKARRGGTKYHAYVHELTVEDHLDMLLGLHALQGAVVLSGYPSDLYTALLGGWKVFERETHADGARKRTEYLWLNARAIEGMKVNGNS